MKFLAALLTVFLFLLANEADGQYLNIQHHLDFGKDRHYFTNTLEGLAFDKNGAWFGFIDVDHRSARSGSATHDWQPGAQLIYFEINRYFSLSRLIHLKQVSSWDFTLQYNDSDAGFIPYAYLFGLSWNNIFSPFLDAHVEFLFRQEEHQKPGWQFTGVWFKTWQFLKTDWQFLGYSDWWKNDAGKFFMAEPQLVFNLKNLGLGKRFWFGTEWEINIGEKSSYNSINPTLFLRYDF